MWNSMQKKIVLIIFVLLFIMSISGTVAATESNITNCTALCHKDIANPPKCNYIAQNNYCNTFTLPSCPQFSCTKPKYTCEATTGILSTGSPNPHESAIIEKIKPNICSDCKVNIPTISTPSCPSCLNIICSGNDPCIGNNPPICIIPSIPSICDPCQTDNGQSPGPGDITNVTGEIRNNGGAVSSKPKVNAATVHLLETGLPVGLLVAAILMVFAGLVPKRK